ncbi:MAG: flagellar biosynthesis regulator FlaF [Deltaproteobacteria bacterium]|nr:flagellar biosynthesis regulator FlaF [Deltaproteobacteria bacterium]
MPDPRLDAYKKVERITSTPRQTEARVLTTGAIKLGTCLENWDAENRKEVLNEALKYNRRVWTVFQCAVTSPDCPLPDNLRLNILKLSAYIDKQIFKALARPSPELLSSIIEINLGLAKGLNATPPRTTAMDGGYLKH